MEPPQEPPAKPPRVPSHQRETRRAPNAANSEPEAKYHVPHTGFPESKDEQPVRKKKRTQPSVADDQSAYDRPSGLSPSPHLTDLLRNTATSGKDLPSSPSSEGRKHKKRKTPDADQETPREAKSNRRGEPEPRSKGSNVAFPEFNDLPDLGTEFNQYMQKINARDLSVLAPGGASVLSDKKCRHLSVVGLILAMPPCKQTTLYDLSCPLCLIRGKPGEHGLHDNKRLIESQWEEHYGAGMSAEQIYEEQVKRWNRDFKENIPAVPELGIEAKPALKFPLCVRHAFIHTRVPSLRMKLRIDEMEAQCVELNSMIFGDSPSGEKLYNKDAHAGYLRVVPILRTFYNK